MARLPVTFPDQTDRLGELRFPLGDPRVHVGGVAGGLFTHVGEWEKFWGLILPHGLLEISAVIVAGGAGLRLGWTVISPGEGTKFLSGSSA